jgi:S1-C subfamily serine protease
MNILELSRAASTKLVSQSGHSSGTGFLIGDQYVVTCFHVVASLVIQGGNVNWTLFPDLQVTLSTGETISGTVVSIPSSANPSPIHQDFAVVKLMVKPTVVPARLEFATGEDHLTVGDEVVFSGFPLATPGMVTHRGMVSGWDDLRSLIFVQAAINKGNSGGALLNVNGRVAGIISMREGGISQGLQQLTAYIDQTAQHGSVQLMGVDPLQATKAIVQTLDQYISTGIGYARAIRFADSYLATNPNILG